MAKSKKTKILHHRRPAMPKGQTSPREAIEEALARWARPAIPDYSSFGEWIEEKFTRRDRDFVLPQPRTHTTTEVAGFIHALLELHGEYEERVRVANQAHATKGESYRLLINSLKLLVFGTEGLSARTKETFALAAAFLTSSQRLDEDLSSCSQSELRARFFIALQREEDRVALKLLGKLREQDHDKGELAYLESLCHFHANEFAEAIFWAKKVPAGTIDYPSARAVILEALAFLGNAAGLLGELQAHSPNEITPSFLSYLMQLSIRQSKEPDEVVAAFNELGKHWRPNRPHTSKDPFFAPFNRYSCKIAKELAIALQDMENQQTYLRDGKEQFPSSEDSLDLHARRILYACMVDNSLLEDLLNAKADERFVPIVKRLLNVPYPAEFADFAEALRTQWELGAIDTFVQNVAANLQNLLNTPNEAKWNLIELAYTEASATDHQQLPTLQEALEEHGGGEQRKKALDQNVQTARLRHELTAKGWHFFHHANQAYEQSLSDGSPWQDAGMVSLALFRILEVELNERIILPLVTSMDVDALRSLPKPAKTQNDQSIPHNIIDGLSHIRDGRKRGLELGALFLLLERTRAVTEPDKDRKKLLHDAIARHLTSAGNVAYEDGRLSATINPVARERYRNPPAHSRFLPQAVATECKEHVEKALLEVITWTPKP